MELTPTEALDLLRHVARDVAEAQERLDLLREARNELLQQLDGQEGMHRTAMADAVGMTRMALWKLLDRRPEGVEEDVLMSDALRRALDDVLEHVEASDRIRLDVHA